MTGIVIRHDFVSPAVDAEGVSGIVQPTHWNEDHVVVLSGILALFDALTAAPNKLPYFVDAENLGLADITEKARQLLAAVNEPAMLAVLGAAPANSPSLSGTPTAPTAALGTNTLQIATTAFVKAAIDALLAAAPGALDTLNELALALGNDPNFATTVTNAMAAKAPLASPAFTGTPAGPTAAPGTNTTQLATTAFVAALAALLAPLASPALTGVPTAPTATTGANNTQIATTAFVQATAASVGDNNKDIQTLAMAVAELSADRVTLPDGIVDPLKDTSDVDTAGASNLDSGTAGLLKPTRTMIAAATGSVIGNMTANGGNAAAFNGVTSAVGGSCACFASGTTGYVGKNYTTPGAQTVGWAKVYAPSDRGMHGSVNTSVGCTLYLYKNNSAPASGTDGTLVGSVTVAAASDVANVVWTLNGDNSSANFWWVYVVTTGSTDFYIAEVEFYSAAASLLVRSQTFSAAYAPSSARLSAVLYSASSFAINSDIVGRVSRDGGTTWSVATLVAVAALADGSALYMHDGLSLAAQPSGSSMKWRFDTGNSKLIEIRAVGLKWTA